MNLDLTNKTICLAVAVEADIVNINTKNKDLFEFSHDRYYESEALLMFKSWRNNAGDLKDIPIYALCVTGNDPSEETISKFKELGVTYISEYHAETETFFSGFWNIPFCGKWFEENLKEDIIIKLDLDMKIYKPMPDDLFGLENNGVVVGVFDEKHTSDPSWERITPEGYIHQSNTCIMISYRKNGIYRIWYDHLKMMTDKLADEDFIKFMNDIGLTEDDLEEFSFDVLLNEELTDFNIKALEKFQTGECYPYFSTYTEDEKENLYFFHKHIYADDNTKLIQEEIKLVNYIKDKSV